MLDSLSKNWWTFAVRGLVGITFGVLAFVLPFQTLAAFIIVFAAFAIVDGIGSIIAAVRGARTDDRWWAMLLVGIVTTTVGVVAVFLPMAAALAFVLLVAAWVAAIGALEIIAAIQLRKHIKGEWVLFVAGVTGLALAAFLILSPVTSALMLVWAVGAYAILSGALRLGVAFRLRHLRRHEPEVYLAEEPLPAT